jgi:ligand-binding sensor protein
MKMKLTDILPIEKWNDLELDLVKTYHLQASVFNADGIRITSNKNWSNSLCPVIKSLDKGQSFICAVAHMNLSNQAKASKKPVIEECDAGLLKLVVPVFYNGEYLGVIGGCGLLPHEGEVDTFSINKITDMPEEKIKRLASGIPTMTPETARAACGYIGKQLETIVQTYANLAN